MEPFKFSAIAHADHLFCSPLFEAKAERLIDLLELPPGARVLDVGCGKAEFLVRLLERCDASGVGVDLASAMLDAAQAKADARVPGRVEFRREDGLEFVPRAPFDLAICMGATDVLGGFVDALRALREWVVPGGAVLLGEPYWKRDPNPEYLDVLEAEIGTYSTLGGNVAIAESEGLIPLYTAASSEDEWDEYEGLYNRAVQRYLAAHLFDPDRDEMQRRIDLWRRTYFHWGRETLGFGFYLLQRPKA